MGYDDERARGLLRVSLGRFNTQQEVDRFLEILPRAVATLCGTENQHERKRSIEALAGAFS
jgi:cysteine sulfinate desulfinase/cysteine desulfurase-like protein